ncbi:MAG: selenocysteine-specific translation elongation factor, partial [Candidatus Neomarinimicrobiota bacterium]
MSQVVIGTAGHIDHGKTALVKALTGTDTDQLAEEKARGLTIDLGFAFLDENITIIDVPGHEKFIRNMVAGVSTIQIALLVIAGDDGIMPQTKEHLHILNLLSIQKGVIVLTKTDLVKDPDWLELVELDIQDLVKGTFLEKAPILHTSINPLNGIDDLRTTLIKIAASIRLGENREFFRLPVDRVFNKKGFGAVVTGTVLSGTAEVGSVLEIVPGNFQVKVRGMQSHGKEIDKVVMGSRAALNLSGTDKKALWRGAEICSPGWMQGTQRLIAHISLIKGSRWILKSRQRIHVHLTTAEVMALVRIPGNKVLKAGESGNVILDFSEPISTAYNDRFILRSFSPMETMGGGLVLDPRPELNNKALHKWAAALKIDPVKRFGQFVDLYAGRPKSSLKWAKHLGQSQVWLKQVMNLIPLVDRDDMVFSKEILERSKIKLQQILSVFHKNQPYQKSLSFEPILQSTNFTADWLTFVLKKAQEDKIIQKISNGFALIGFEGNLSKADQALSNLIKNTLQDRGFDFPSANHIAAGLERNEKRVLQILHYLKAGNEVDEIMQDLWIDSSYLD